MLELGAAVPLRWFILVVGTQLVISQFMSSSTVWKGRMTVTEIVVICRSEKIEHIFRPLIIIY